MGLQIEPETEMVYLYRSEDRQRLDELAEKVSSAIARQGPRTMAEGDPAMEYAAEYDVAVGAAKERATKVLVKELPKDVWRDLVAANPPRVVKVKEADASGVEVEAERIHEDDEAFGFDIQTMADDLVPLALDVAGQFDDDAERDKFIAALSKPRFSQIFWAAVSLSSTGRPAPKADLSLRLAQMSAEISSLQSLSD